MTIVASCLQRHKRDRGFVDGVGDLRNARAVLDSGLRL